MTLDPHQKTLGNSMQSKRWIFWLTKNRRGQTPVKTVNGYLKCYNFPSIVSHSFMSSAITALFLILVPSQSSPVKNSRQQIQKQAHHLSPQLLSNLFFFYEFL